MEWKLWLLQFLLSYAGYAILTALVLFYDLDSIVAMPWYKWILLTLAMVFGVLLAGNSIASN